MFTHYIDTTSTAVINNTAVTNNAAVIGGAVGGTVLLILLCSIFWCMIHCYKKKGASRTTRKQHFTPAPILFYNYDSSHGSELTSIKINEAEVDSEMEARICK